MKKLSLETCELYNGHTRHVYLYISWDFLYVCRHVAFVCMYIQRGPRNPNASELEQLGIRTKNSSKFCPGIRTLLWNPNAQHVVRVCLCVRFPSARPPISFVIRHHQTTLERCFSKDTTTSDPKPSTSDTLAKGIKKTKNADTRTTRNAVTWCYHGRWLTFQAIISLLLQLLHAPSSFLFKVNTGFYIFNFINLHFYSNIIIIC